VFHVAAVLPAAVLLLLPLSLVHASSSRFFIDRCLASVFLFAVAASGPYFLLIDKFLFTPHIVLLTLTFTARWSTIV
jgi:hypothetical protein